MSLLKRILAVSLLFAGFNSRAQEPDQYKGSIDSLLSTNAVRPFNGVVMIAQRGRIQYARAKGYADLNRKTALTVDAPFVILSNSKQITAVLVLLEVEKGRINLHAPIRRYLPDPGPVWTDSVTVHQLLNHTSGVAGPDRPLLFKPGSDFRYSDWNYVLLGKIIEHTTGKTYRETVNALFERCGMKNTFFPDSTRGRMPVKGYEYPDDRTIKEVPGIMIPAERIPAAGIVTTARDLTRWNTLLHGGKLLKKATYTAMTTYSITAQHPVFGNSKIGYGYGIRVNDKDINKELRHTGIVPEQGFTSVNLYYPATGTSVVVLEN